MAYVRKHGRPDLFITFTCNPSWKEIQTELFEGQKSDQKRDLLARVSHLKLKKLMDVMTNGEVFGATICHMYTIEWQKRGPPHAHILLWLPQKLRPTDIDLLISVEFPDPSNDPQLYNVTKSNMVHGPCVAVNPKSKSMEHGKLLPSRSPGRNTIR